MTQEEFGKMVVRANTKVEYDGKSYPIGSVNFLECLFGLILNECSDDSDIMWVRCENVNIKQKSTF